ncbi:cytochrome P450 [Athelia psychrophila]|uniref:Cytochrome P450 n=1 Tax=Athelia psychrophila TaxID=1759441 RepID=A0A166SS31_9AGAM|nr:cytochrome P450 [Fibularhizoctonia sp. CBS 109695]
MAVQLALVLSCFVLAAVYLVKARTRASKYPPGPPGQPLIGNMLDMPARDEFLQYAKWSQEYKSDVIHLNIFGTHLVILNSLEATSDLLEKRSAIYSSRPATPMLRLMGWSWSLALMPTDAAWAAQRRHFREEFDGLAIHRHYPAITSATHDLLKRFLDTPEHWGNHLRHMVGATILDIAYGIEVLPVGDPYIRTAEASFLCVSQATLPGAFLVDMLPILKHVPSWMPGAGFQRKAKEWKKLTDAVYQEPFTAVKQDLARGTAKPSFCSRSLRDAEAVGEMSSEEPHIQAAAAGMFGAGSDTTVSFLETLVLAMVLHPEAQVKAQAELDLTLGSDRLPTFSDQESLPFLSAVVRECYRWRVVAPLGVPRMLTVDDEYKGYLIPKGSIIIANSYQILNDEKAYLDPSSFKPERFLKDGKLDPSVRNPTRVAAFGYGRRVCPGRAVAEQSAWLAAGSILAMFDISKAVDREGAIIEPSGRYTSGLTRHPEAFKCRIKPRSNETRDLINST